MNTAPATNAETVVRVRGSITATVTEVTARDIEPTDIIVMGQSAVRVSEVDVKGNFGVRRIFGHTGALAAAVSAPWEDFLPADTPVYRVVRESKS